MKQTKSLLIPWLNVGWHLLAIFGSCWFNGRAYSRVNSKLEFRSTFSDISKWNNDFFDTSISEGGEWRWLHFSFWRSLPTNPQYYYYINLYYIYNIFNVSGWKFESIFMKVIWLRHVYLWMNHIVFGNKWPP